MKLLNDLFRLCGQIMSSMFDSNLDYYEDSKEVKVKVKEKEKEQEKTEHMMYKLPNLIEELNRLRSQTADENVISTINFCESRIEEMMLSCGCNLIDKDVSFDCSRHVPHPFSFVPDGCTIERIIKPGLSYENKVLVKAIVKCKQ